MQAALCVSGVWALRGLACAVRADAELASAAGRMCRGTHATTRAALVLASGAAGAGLGADGAWLGPGPGGEGSAAAGEPCESTAFEALLAHCAVVCCAMPVGCCLGSWIALPAACVHALHPRSPPTLQGDAAARWPTRTRQQTLGCRPFSRMVQHGPERAADKHKPRPRPTRLAPHLHVPGSQCGPTTSEVTATTPPPGLSPTCPPAASARS